ncbi:MAG: cyclic nucleotide-binding domain-containing protein [Gammaproteobacteria bacterium]
MLRRLKFFHEFSHAEIWEVLRASQWQDYAPGEEIVKEGEMDDRFYIIVSGQCAVERHAHKLGGLDTGDCFGEASYVQGAKRTATIRAANAVTVLKVSSTLLEQVSASCQLRFNRVFLRHAHRAAAERRAVGELIFSLSGGRAFECPSAAISIMISSKARTLVRAFCIPGRAWAR